MAKAKGKNFGQRMQDLRLKKIKDAKDAELLACFLPQVPLPDMNNPDKPQEPKPIAPETYIQAVPPSPSQTMMERALQSLREKSQGI